MARFDMKAEMQRAAARYARHEAARREQRERSACKLCNDAGQYETTKCSFFCSCTVGQAKRLQHVQELREEKAKLVSAGCVDSKRRVRAIEHELSALGVHCCETCADTGWLEARETGAALPHSIPCYEAGCTRGADAARELDAAKRALDSAPADDASAYEESEDAFEQRQLDKKRARHFVVEFHPQAPSGECSLREVFTTRESAIACASTWMRESASALIEFRACECADSQHRAPKNPLTTLRALL